MSNDRDPGDEDDYTRRIWARRDALIRARLATVPEMTAAERQRQRESWADSWVRIRSGS